MMNMKRIVFIVALVFVILIIGLTGKCFLAEAAPLTDNGEEVDTTEVFFQELKTFTLRETEHNEDAILLAQVVYGEAGGIKSITEQACVMWTILNRIDMGGYGDTVKEVACYGAYYYQPWFYTVDGYGRDLVWLAEDVLARWKLEKLGGTNVGRVLPPEYLWFGGDGEHNWFRSSYEFSNGFWNYSLPSPYES